MARTKKAAKAAKPKAKAKKFWTVGKTVRKGTRIPDSFFRELINPHGAVAGYVWGANAQRICDALAEFE